MANIKVAFSTIHSNCSIDKKSIKWSMLPIEDIKLEILHNNPNSNKVALVYRRDICLDDKIIISRSQFESDPIKYGIAIYKRRNENRLIYE